MTLVWSTPIFIWWLFCVAVSGWYVGVLMVVWSRTHDIVAMLYLMVSLSLLIVFSINVMVRGGFTPLSAECLIAVQRGMYAPLLLALGVLIDIYLAEHNGHVSVMQRLVRRFENDRENQEGAPMD